MLINTVYQIFWCFMVLYVFSFHNCVFEKNVCFPDVYNILYMFISSSYLIMVLNLPLPSLIFFFFDDVGNGSQDFFLFLAIQ